MLGREAVELFASWGYQVISASKDELNITDGKMVSEFCKKHHFDYVLHCASYTKVDDAESNRDLAFLVNEIGTRNIAAAASVKDVPIIYISTDYVFDGLKGNTYSPDDKTSALNVYGESKLAGENVVKEVAAKYYITRTSWLYGKHGKNFVDTMIALSKSQKSLKVVNDQFGCPTYTADLVFGIKQLIEEKKPFGTYHLCNSGVTTWCDFAKKIFEILKINIEVIAVSTSEFPRPAKRPKFSAMNNGGLLRNWEEALREYLKLQP